MRTLLEVAAELKRINEILNRDVYSIDPRNRSGWEALRNQSLAQKETMEKMFSDLIVENGYGLFLVGSAEAVKTATDIASDMARVVVVDARAMYEQIAKAMDATFGVDRLFNVTQAQKIQSEVINIARDLGIIALPQPGVTKWVRSLVLPNLEAATNFVRTALRETMKDDLNMMFLRSELTKAGLKVEFTQNTVPVLVLNASKEELSGDLFTKLFPHNFEVVLPDDETAIKNEIVLVFNKIKTFASAKKRARKNP